MPKLLKNAMESLDSVVMGTSGLQFGDGAAQFFSVADLTDFDAKTPDGVLLRRYVWRQFLDVQRNALEHDQRLHPNATVSVLADETEQAYTVNGILVPSKKNKDGFEVAAVCIADAVSAEGGPSFETYIKFWYLPTTQKGLEGAYLTLPEKPTLVEHLLRASVSRVEEAAGEDPFVFFDDQCSRATLDLVRKDPKVVAFLRNVKVPDLSASGKELEKAARRATLYIRPNSANSSGMDAVKAGNVVADYFVNGFGVKHNNPLLLEALGQINAWTREGIFHYSGMRMLNPPNQ